MTSVAAWSPSYAFNNDPDPQNKINAAALQAQLMLLSKWSQDLSTALEVITRNDNALTDSSVRMRCLHPEITEWLDSLITGTTVTEALLYKKPVRARSTAPISYLYGLPGIPPGPLITDVDNENMIEGDRVLVMNQTNPIENGIYIIHLSALWERAPDLPAGAQEGPFGIIVRSGSAYKETVWVYTSGGDITERPVVGTDPLSWFALSGPFPLAIARGGTGAGTAAGARTNLSTAGTYNTTISGDDVTTSFPITHSLGSIGHDVTVVVFNMTDDSQVHVDIEITGVGTCTVHFVTPPASGDSYTVCVLG